MKVKDLIKELHKYDSELEVCVFSDNDCSAVDDYEFSIHSGTYYAPHPGHKLIPYRQSSVFLALNNSANFDIDQKDFPLVFDDHHHKETNREEALEKAAEGLLQFIRDKYPIDFEEGGVGFICPHHQAIQDALELP